MRILFDPAPRTAEEIFSDEDRERFFDLYDVTEFTAGDRHAFYPEVLPKSDIVVSQQPLDRAALDAAPNLRAIINVETNFLPNIDYEACFERGIHVLAPSSVFALPVAEIGLGMALSLARDIHTAHGDFAGGRERYGLDGNQRAELLSGSDIGFVGFGDLGRALFHLLAGFSPHVRVFDPWLPDGHLRRLGVEPAGLDTVLASSRVVFIVSTVTTENTHLIDAERLALMQEGAMLVLLSRAAVVDFEALAAACSAGRIRAATDVFPDEPVKPDDPIRKVPNLLFSAHRAGALTSALQEIGARVLEDLGLIARGLPPVACRRAERETVGRIRSKPIEAS